MYRGPQYDTVSSKLIQEAAKEAVKGLGFDLLIICGMSFDPHVYEEAKRYPKPKILLSRMNPDLSMGDELLKKTGAGNLFTVFGEPDIEIRASERQRQVGSGDQGAGRVRSDNRTDPLQLHRRYSLLVYRHAVQRRELLRPPRLLLKRSRIELPCAGVLFRGASAFHTREEKVPKVPEACHSSISPYSLYCREDPFSAIQLPVMGVLGN